MTKKELAAKMKEFIELQSDYDKDDWYDTSKGFASRILHEFAEFLNINLDNSEGE